MIVNCCQQINWLIDFASYIFLSFYVFQWSRDGKKVKVAHTRLPSVWFRIWFRFLAVSLQITWVINPAVGCHYFPTGLQLPPQPLRELLLFCCLVNRRTVGVNSLPMTVTQQHRDYDLNPGPSVSESSTLITRLPSHVPEMVQVVIVIVKKYGASIQSKAAVWGVWVTVLKLLKFRSFYVACEYS